MAMFGMLARRLWTLLRRQQVDGGLDQEMQLHVALLERQLRDEGIPADQARMAARRRFGNSLRLREECRDAWGWTASLERPTRSASIRNPCSSTRIAWKTDAVHSPRARHRPAAAMSFEASENISSTCCPKIGSPCS